MVAQQLTGHVGRLLWGVQRRPGQQLPLTLRGLGGTLGGRAHGPRGRLSPPCPGQGGQWDTRVRACGQCGLGPQHPGGTDPAGLPAAEPELGRRRGGSCLPVPPPPCPSRPAGGAPQPQRSTAGQDLLSHQTPLASLASSPPRCPAGRSPRGATVVPAVQSPTSPVPSSGQRPALCRCLCFLRALLASPTPCCLQVVSVCAQPCLALPSCTRTFGSGRGQGWSVLGTRG